MSSNNNDNAGISLVVGLAFAAVYVAGMILAIGLALLAGFCTIIAIMAWNRPIRVHKWTVTPAEARDFVKRGIYGQGLFILVLILGETFLGWRVNWSYTPYYLIAGYSLGSIGLEMLIGDESRSGPLVEYLPPQQVPQPKAAEPAPLPAPAREEFRFASWEDEER